MSHRGREHGRGRHHGSSSNPGYQRRRWRRSPRTPPARARRRAQLDDGVSDVVDHHRTSTVRASPRRRLLIPQFVAASSRSVRGGQLLPVVLRPDGFGVAVPDRQLRHGLLLGLRRPVGRADGVRGTAARCSVGPPRHDRRHVVPLGHRRRPARPRSRGEGGRYLLVGPGHDGPLPGQWVSRLSCPYVTSDR